jgi:hypothetical protein
VLALPVHHFQLSTIITIGVNTHPLSSSLQIPGPALGPGQRYVYRYLNGVVTHASGTFPKLVAPTHAPL